MGEPLPVVVPSPWSSILGLFVWSAGHATICCWLSPPWPTGIKARTWHPTGLICILSFGCWEFFTAFDELRERRLQPGVD